MRSGLSPKCVATTKLYKQGSKDSAHALANVRKIGLVISIQSLYFIFPVHTMPPFVESKCFQCAKSHPL